MIKEDLNINNEEVKKIFINYFKALIEYFEIKDIDNFLNDIVPIIKRQPKEDSREEIKIRWLADYTGTVLMYSTLSEEELKKRYNKELEIILNNSNSSMEVGVNG